MYQVRQVEISHHLKKYILSLIIGISCNLSSKKKLESKLEWAKIKMNFAIAGITNKLF